MSQDSAALVAPPAAASSDLAATMMGFGSLQSFEFLQRTAKLFAVSSMVPAAYQAVVTKGFGDKATYEQNPAALSNCIIALDMSQRMNASPLMIMQNLHIIEGRPSWSSQFIIAAINNCGKFSPLRFDLEWLDEIDATYSTFDWQEVNGRNKKVETKHTVKIKNARCIAWAIEKETGARLESAPVTMEMAVAEGWYGKNGSKWKTMPDLLMRYRSAAFFGRIYAPELLMGLPAAEEVHDIIDVERQKDGTYAAPEPDPEAAAAVEKRKPRAPTAKGATVGPNASEAATKAAATANATDVEITDVPQNDAGKAGNVDLSTGEVLDAVIEQQPHQPDLLATQDPEDPPLSGPKMDWAKGKLEEMALSTGDFFNHFKFQLADARESQFNAIRDWLRNPS